MPIEDVDFLLKNSEKDANLLFIDSSTRNKEFFPYPNKYTIDFEEPFSNVYGVEILDALVPSTMYNVETFNNTIKYGVAAFYNTFNSGMLNDRLVEIGEYIPFAKLFKSQLEAIMVFVDSSFIIEGKDQIGGEGEGLHIHVYKRTVILIDRIHMKTTPINPNDHTHYFASRGQYYGIPNDVYSELSTDAKYAIDNEYPYVDIATGSITYFSNIRISLDTYMNTFINTHPSLSGIDVILYQRTTLINIGNYDILTIQSFMQSNMVINAYEPFKLVQISVPNASGDTNVTQQMRIGLEIDYSMHDENVNDMCLLFDVDNSTFADSMGFATTKSLNFENMSLLSSIYKPQYFLTLSFAGQSRLLMGINNNETKQSRIESPGIVNMTSNVRYMLLRCPEIETHLHNSFAFGRFCPGIGLFKHTGNNDQNNYRFDFTNFVKKPFHPIGKLRKITLSFELANGTPYDFKGVDHIILLSIKFYSVKNAIGMPNTDASLLNPNYNANFIEYFIKKGNRSITSDSDSGSGGGSDNSDTNNEANVKDMVQQQNQYDFSSDDESGDNPDEIEWDGAFKSTNR
jgi:hypothetical protein